MDLPIECFSDFIIEQRQILTALTVKFYQPARICDVCPCNRPPGSILTNVGNSGYYLCKSHESDFRKYGNNDLLSDWIRPQDESAETMTPIAFEGHPVSADTDSKRFAAFLIRYSSDSANIVNYTIADSFIRNHSNTLDENGQRLFKGDGDKLVILDNLFVVAAKFQSAKIVQTHRHTPWQNAKNSANYYDLVYAVNEILAEDEGRHFTIVLRDSCDLSGPRSFLLMDLICFDFPERTHFLISQGRGVAPLSINVADLIDAIILVTYPEAIRLSTDTKKDFDIKKFLYDVEMKLQAESSFQRNRLMRFIDPVQYDVPDPELVENEVVDFLQPNSTVPGVILQRPAIIQYLPVIGNFFSIRTPFIETRRT